MRRARRHEYVFRNYAMEKKHRILHPIVTIFNKEFSIVIKLIRLVSEGSISSFSFDSSEMIRKRVFVLF